MTQEDMDKMGQMNQDSPAPGTESEPSAQAVPEPAETSEASPTETQESTSTETAEHTPDPGTVNADYVKTLEDQIKKYEEVNGKLLDLVEANPELMDVISGMMNGKKFRSAILSVISTDDLLPKEGDEDYPDAMMAVQERQKKLDEKRKREDDIIANTEASAKAIEDFKTEHNLSDEDLKSFLETTEADISDILEGKVTTKFLKNLWKAYNHDSNVANAADQARIDGLNANIEVKKQTKKDDGLPSVVASSDLPPTPAKKPSYIDNLVNIEKRKKII